jgi:uncharacterized membrane protein
MGPHVAGKAGRIKGRAALPPSHHNRARQAGRRDIATPPWGYPQRSEGGWMGLRATAILLLFGALMAQTAAAADAEAPTVTVAAAAADTVEIRASIVIAAPRPEVWAIMTDCTRATRFIPGLQSCRILERDPAGHWDIREHRISWMWFLPDVLSVFRSDYDAPARLRFHRISGTLKRSDGDWRLDAIDGGQATRVFYDATLSADIPAPQFMVEEALKRDIATVLRRLRRECMKAETSQ